MAIIRISRFMWAVTTMDRTQQVVGTAYQARQVEQQMERDYFAKLYQATVTGEDSREDNEKQEEL